MRKRFKVLLLSTALAVAALAVAPVAAQIAPLEPPTGDPPKPIEPPAPENLPKAPQQGDPRQNLDKLFEALKIAPTDDSAKYVENRIWALWIAAGGDTANLLMGRVKTAMDGRDLDLAIRLLNAIIDIRPDYVEGWNRRATVYYARKDYANALADIHEVLAREPRHF